MCCEKKTAGSSDDNCCARCPYLRLMHACMDAKYFMLSKILPPEMYAHIVRLRRDLYAQSVRILECRLKQMEHLVEQCCEHQEKKEAQPETKS
ncbi:MAG: hypothetical protein WC712_06480 [Candidatus Brocadiia bacterium]